jgi:MFS family permease
MAGLGLFTAASLGAALAGSEAVLIGMRAAQGLGAAMLIPAALSTVRNMFAEGGERNKALGIWGALGAGGASVGIILGGLLTRYAGWQYVFFINVPVGATALLLAPRLIPESRLQTARRYDPFGAVTVTAGLVLLVYAISQAPRYGWGATRTLAGLAGALALLAAFLVIESRAEAPLMPLRIFRLRTLAGSNAAGLMLGGSFYAFIFIGTLYMQQVLGYSPLKGGFTWLVASLASVAFAGLSQLLVTRGSVRVVMALGMTLIGGGILWATQVPVHGQFWADLFGPLLVVGIGTAFAFIPISIGALTGVAESEAGLASGLIYTSQELGGALGIAIASSVAATHYKSLMHAGSSVPAALTGGFQQAFWVLGAIALVAVPVIFLLIRRTEPAAHVEPSGVLEPQPAIASAD